MGPGEGGADDSTVEGETRLRSRQPTAGRLTTTATGSQANPIDHRTSCDVGRTGIDQKRILSRQGQLRATTHS